MKSGIEIQSSDFDRDLEEKIVGAEVSAVGLVKMSDE